jgi:rfaE bifunctional protein kinase chain/domain
MQEYLGVFRQRYDLSQIAESIDGLSRLKVLVVGDVILDAYQYCDAIGKSSKDPILAMKYKSEELFAGGALAVANHAAGFASEVSLLSWVGDDGYETFARANLRDNVRPEFLVRRGSPTTLKRRFIDAYSLNKLMEVYNMDDSEIPEEMEKVLLRKLEEHFDSCDLVIAADFGHGAVTRRMVDLLSSKAPFLAVNAQSNAGNRGFNTITKYPRADFVSIAEHELRLDARDLAGDHAQLTVHYAERLKARYLYVTRGSRGCAGMADGDFFQVPAFASKVVDRVGAGDTFLSVTALAAYAKLPPEVVGFLGNMAGAIAVGVVGNMKYLDAASLKKAVTAIMK